MAPAPTRRQWGLVVGIAAYVLVVGSGTTALAVSGADVVAVSVLGAVATAGLVAFLAHTLGHQSASLRRVAADTAVVVDANPEHRLGSAGSEELESLVTQINRLADLRESAERGAAEQAEAARRDIESERNRLAALMAQLSVAVVVCNSEGRILLYNQEALSVAGDTTTVGLGRSVFALVDRGLVVHAQERIDEGTDSVYTATTLRGDRLFRVRMAPVREHRTGTADLGAGFVLVLEDLTREVRAVDERERVLRELTQATRASLGSIRAAVESVLEFPEQTGDERRRFLEIAQEEADRLGKRVDELATESAGRGGYGLLAEMAGDDLLGILCSRLAATGTRCTVGSPSSDDVWLRVDGHAVARAVVHLTIRLQQTHGVEDVVLRLTAAGPHAQVDAQWRGSAPVAAVLDAWLDEPLEEGGTSTARDVAERHGAEIWCGDVDAESAYLRMLIPLATGVEGVAASRTAHVEVDSRPEFYDFDLFTAVAEPSDLADRRLDEASFTVFDTETTGLDPVGGDRVISIGAVRVVNGRVLRHETFERLVQPERSVPVASTAIHGITPEMLEGQPTIEEVLPAFARFAEDTVLVGHNVSFDLQFLKLAEPGVGVRLSQPALDTLLLHAALNPDGDEHSLEAIADRLGVSVVGRHTALGDALVTAEVFVGLVAMLRGRGVETLGDALGLARRTYQARVDQRLYGP